MALPQAAALALSLILTAAGALAQAAPAMSQAAPAMSQAAPAIVSPPTAAPAPAGASDTPDASLSPECRVPGSKLYTLAKLKAVKAALREKRPVRVLAIGSPSAGIGATATYPVKLETALERSLTDVDVAMDSRGLPGEIASGAGERLRAMVAELEPDLVIWQVGTHDALARVDVEAFSNALDETVRWIKSHEIDVVLVNPLYTASLAQDEYYTSIVTAVRTVAAREGVPLVQRYEAMRYLSGHGDKAEPHMLGRQFRLNDLGLRCMAEHVTRAITLSLLQTEAAALPLPEPPLPEPPPASPPSAGDP